MIHTTDQRKGNLYGLKTRFRPDPDRKVDRSPKTKKWTPEQKEALIKQAQIESRVTPPMLETVKSMAANCDVAMLDSFLATLPPQVHVDVASVIPVPLDPDSTDHPSGLSAHDRVVKAVFGVDAKWIKATELVKSIDCKGDFILKDGTVKTKAELLEMV